MLRCQLTGAELRLGPTPQQEQEGRKVMNLRGPGADSQPGAVHHHHPRVTTAKDSHHEETVAGLASTRAAPPSPPRLLRSAVAAPIHTAPRAAAGISRRRAIARQDEVRASARLGTHEPKHRRTLL